MDAKTTHVSRLSTPQSNVYSQRSVTSMSAQAVIVGLSPGDSRVCVNLQDETALVLLVP